MPVNDHEQVRHPWALLRPAGWSDWAADHLVALIGTAACLWVFIVVPLATLLFPRPVQDFVFFLASGWVQLWALSAIVYGQTKADRKRDAKADTDHAALTHIATQIDTILATTTAVIPVSDQEHKHLASRDTIATEDLDRLPG